MAARTALQGIRVIDFGQFIAGPLLAMMLADGGADVIRVDPPTGPVWRNPANAILQRGKQSIALNLKDSADQATARRLISSADVVVENFRPGVMDRLGLGPAAMLVANHRLIYCSLPGFPANDPRNDIAAYEGIVAAATGVYLPSAWDLDGDPVYNPLPLCSTFAAIQAATAIAAALICRERCGLGQSIEVPLFDAAFEAFGHFAEHRPGEEKALPVFGSPRGALGGHFECADGRFVNLSWLEQRQIPRFVERFLPDALRIEGITDLQRLRSDPELAAELRRRLAPVFQTKTAREWDAIANPDSDLAECLSTEEWLRDDAHARQSRAVISLADPELGLTDQAGYPVTLSETPPTAQGPRHALDADRESIIAELNRLPAVAAGRGSSLPLSQALEGFRALDVTQVLAGPTACRILAEYGCDVVRINNPASPAGDYHLYANSGKRTITLNLKSTEGQEVLRRLIEQSDIMSTNFTPDGARALGVSYDEVRQIRRDIVYSAISTYGFDGPRGANKGHEQMGQAVTGMELRWGQGNATPIMQRILVNDYGTGNLAAFAILLGLYHRLRTGSGQFVGASLAQTATLHQIPFMIRYEGRIWDEPAGQKAKGWGPYYRLYRASDRWFFLAATKDDDKGKVLRIAGLADGGHLTPHELTSALEAKFTAAAAASWVERLAADGVAAHELVSLQENMDAPTVQERGLSITRDHEGVGAVVNIGPPARLSLTPLVATAPAPPPGWHLREVLEEIGLLHRLKDLVATGAVLEPARPAQPVSRDA